MSLRGLPIFWQTLGLLIAALLVAQAVNVGLLWSLPPQRGEFHQLSELGDVLRGQRPDPKHGRARMLAIETASAPPGPTSSRMVQNPGFTRRLADQLGRPVSDVRLFYEADQSGRFPYRAKQTDAGVPLRRGGEPIFFNSVVAAARDGTVWRVVRTPPRPWLSEWQKRLMLQLGLSALALLPIALLFARRLARPIRRFAAAAERLGDDPDAPSVPVEGPSELRQTAQALNAVQARLHETLAERTAMIGAIAHDLRTPLARIAFRIEAAPEELRAAVQRDVEQMRSMVAATIGFVRGTPGAGERVPVDLAALLGRIAEHGREMGAEVSLAAPASATVSGDPVALERLFQNLVDNALQYGGRAELVLERRAEEVVVTVADRGPGLPAELLDAVFQPFRRGEPSRSRTTGGVGLGLAIARSIAAAHRGTVTAANRAGGGLEMTVRLPLSD